MLHSDYEGCKRKVKNAGCHWESNPEPLTSATSALTTELHVHV